MSIHSDDLPIAPGDERADAIEHVVADVEDEIRHGRVPGYVTRVLRERLDAAGIALAPDAVEDLAETIENDVSL